MRKALGSEGPVRGGPIIAGIRALSKLIPNKVDVDQVPRAIVEGAPGLATDVVAAGAMGPAGAALTYGARNLGPEAEARAAKRTGQEGATPDLTDKLVAGGSTAVQAGMNAAGVRPLISPSRGIGAVPALGNVAKSTAAQGTTGTAQDVVSQAGHTIGTPGGLDINGPQAGMAGITQAGLGSALHAPKLARDVTATAKFRDLGGDLTEASTRVANRLQERADNLANPKHARSAVEAVSQDLHTELTAARKHEGSYAPFAALPDADNALARITSGGKATKGDLAALDTAARDAGDGAQHIRDLARQAASLNLLKETGHFGPRSFKGGMAAGIERSARLFTHPTTTLTTAGLGMLGAPSGATAAVAGLAAPHVPVAVGATAAAYAGARALDKLLATRSPAATFAGRCGDPNVPVRLPQAASAAREPQRPTGPEVSQTAMPWGDKPTAAHARGEQVAAKLEAKSARSLDKAGLLVETGIGRITDKLERSKQREFVQSSEDALRKLAASTKGPTLASKANGAGKTSGADKANGKAAPDAEPDYSKIGQISTPDYIRQEVAVKHAKGLIDSPEHYRAFAERRDGLKASIAQQIADTVPYLGEPYDFLGRMRKLSSADKARDYRESLKSQVAPNEAEALAVILSDKAIDQIWKAKR